MSERWSHRNHKEAVLGRQARLRQLPGWRPDSEPIFDWAVNPEQLGRFQECLTGQLVLPVGVVGPMDLELGRYRTERDGAVEEIERQRVSVYVPLAHTEGGLSASMLRGMQATAESGGIRTYLLHNQMTRDCAFVFTSADQAVAFSRWVDQHAAALQDWVNDPDNTLKDVKPGETVAALSSHAMLLAIRTRVVGPVCHLLYRFHTGEACGPNMMTRNAYSLNREIVERSSAIGYRPQHVFLEANLGGDKKPSYEYYAGGHGKTVLATATITHAVLRHRLHIDAAALQELEWVGLHGAHVSGMQSFSFTPASAIAAIFAATGQDLGMIGTSSMAHGVVKSVPEGVTFSLQLGGIEVGTVGGGTSLPHAQAYLNLMECTGAGSAERLAQIIAGAALALEVSAASSMASRGSENFFRAHLEHGGLRF
jgi:hydroxymethylglutaryl-CoA reductase (NADPH)